MGREEGGGEAGKGGKRDQHTRQEVGSCMVYLYPVCASSSASVLNSSYIFLRETQHHCYVNHV